MNMKDKVVAITGGGRGLGRAMALAFAGRGAHVALLDLNPADLDETKRLVEAQGVRAAGYVTNVASEENVVASMDAIVRDFGRLDVLVNNAGITKDGLLIKVKDGEVTGKMSLDQWNAVIGVNLTGVFLCGREAAERMIRLGNGGVIINISSISKDGNYGQTNYSAAKAGVAAITVVWAKELSRYGIRSGAIAPGFCATEILSAMKPEVLAKVIDPVPLKRLGLPEEIAHTAVYIAENDFFTGRTIEVDGGLRF
ncbi:MAG: SDR family oxidoreductase [Steroidobacteraceae bacterium]|jgi:3-oxoacyl-[acyl-carrier protein] reductase|nr:SDR family oxidoreductase [Steroidobacteraceae bacterium]